jgi:hypothetical protein
MLNYFQRLHTKVGNRRVVFVDGLLLAASKKTHARLPPSALHTTKLEPPSLPDPLAPWIDGGSRGGAAIRFQRTFFAVSYERSAFSGRQI